MKDPMGPRLGDSEPSRGQRRNRGPEGKTGSSCSLTRLIRSKREDRLRIRLKGIKGQITHTTEELGFYLK